VLVPLPLPFTVVDVNRPVMSDVSMNRSVTAEAVILALMTSCHTPTGAVPALMQGVLELLALTVTVVMAAVALLLASDFVLTVPSPGTSSLAAQPAPSTIARQVAAILVKITIANVLIGASSAGGKRGCSRSAPSRDCSSLGVSRRRMARASGVDMGLVSRGAAVIAAADGLPAHHRRAS
jgi:hypothetical protein